MTVGAQTQQVADRVRTSAGTSQRADVRRFGIGATVPQLEADTTDLAPEIVELFDEVGDGRAADNTLDREGRSHTAGQAWSLGFFELCKVCHTLFGRHLPDEAESPHAPSVQSLLGPVV
ncbi:hypothetical protein [Streptomyces sp. AB3(2024)]|uniref:hypothetical protein n=1 Tax=Streptomyces sp. AB3(2024) TaxID=3317321 RepID=UPI0035A33BC5